LRDALGAAGLESWAQRVGAEGYHDFPLELAGKCGVLRERDRRSLLDIQLTDRYVPPRTVAQPQPVQPHTSFRPRTWRDLLTTEALAKLDALVSKTVASLPPGGAQARRPPALALGQGDLVPQARGLVWDCRGPRPVPQCWQAVAESKINRKAIAKVFRDYPDQDMVEQCMTGVRLKADVAL